MCQRQLGMEEPALENAGCVRPRADTGWLFGRIPCAGCRTIGRLGDEAAGETENIGILRIALH